MEQVRKIKEQIDGLLEKARQSFLAGDFTDAIRDCDDILRLQNDNADAKKIKEDAEDVLKRRELLEQYIDKMDKQLWRVVSSMPTIFSKRLMHSMLMTFA